MLYQCVYIICVKWRFEGEGRGGGGGYTSRVLLSWSVVNKGTAGLKVLGSL